MGDDSLRNREQVFQYIVEYKREHDGVAPSIKEIAETCILSISTVKHHLFMLERTKRIRILGRRAIEVIGGVWNPPDED
jgi:hypothetical protein